MLMMTNAQFHFENTFPRPQSKAVRPVVAKSDWQSITTAVLQIPSHRDHQSANTVHDKEQKRLVQFDIDHLRLVVLLFATRFRAYRLLAVHRALLYVQVRLMNDVRHVEPPEIAYVGQLRVAGTKEIGQAEVVQGHAQVAKAVFGVYPGQLVGDERVSRIKFVGQLNFAYFYCDSPDFQAVYHVV